MSDTLAALSECHFEIKQRNPNVHAFGQGHFARDAVYGDTFIGQRNVRAEADDDVLKFLDFINIGVIDQVAQLNNVRPLCGVRALAVLGRQSGGFGIKYHDLHCACSACIACMID